MDEWSKREVKQGGRVRTSLEVCESLCDEEVKRAINNSGTLSRDTSGSFFERREESGSLKYL